MASMLEATDDDLLRMIREEEERNIALEVGDPAEVRDPAEGGETADGNDTDDTQTLETEMGDGDSPVEVQVEQDDPISLYEYDDDSPSDRIGARYNDDDDDSKEPGSNTQVEVSFREDLKRQIDELEITREQEYLACYIIDSLDDTGYLTIGLQELADELEISANHPTTVEDLEEVLVEIIQQELDPPGIGARDLRECMLLQLLDRKGTPATRLAYMIVDKAFDDLAQKRYDKLQEKFGIGHQTLVDCLRVIRTLQPKPGGLDVTSGSQNVKPAKTANTAMHVRPAFIVTHPETDTENDDSLVVTLNEGRMPEVRVSAEQEAMLEAMNEPKAVKFLKDNIASARTFIDALQQRRVTLMRVMQNIVEMQRKYFLTGDAEVLRPMQMSDIAEKCGCDISTVSRVVSSKYVQTDYGVVALKELFRTAASSEHGDEVSTAAVDAAIKELIDGEDKHSPLTDEALAKLLSDKGFNIARRTVMKYRERMGYPVARLRKEL